MKKFILLILFFCFFLHGYSQKRISIKETSIVKDSSGAVYSSEIWKKLLLTGYYLIKAEEPTNENTAFILIRLTEEEREKRLLNSPKPTESKSFETGGEVKNFSTTDINGNKYKLKDLRGKIVVLNFWFINCPPCREEIFELNKIVQDYKDSTGVVFLAIALDDRSELKDFLKRTPFDYAIVDNGRYIASQYDVKSYPTHVVIDQKGKAYFHTIGTGSGVIYWIRKSIAELMKAGSLNN